MCNSIGWLIRWVTQCVLDSVITALQQKVHRQFPCLFYPQLASPPVFFHNFYNGQGNIVDDISSASELGQPHLNKARTDAISGRIKKIPPALMMKLYSRKRKMGIRIILPGAIITSVQGASCSL